MLLVFGGGLLAGCAETAPVTSFEDADGGKSDDITDVVDGGTADASDANPQPDADVHNGHRLPVCEDTEPMGTRSLPEVPSTLVSQIVPESAAVLVANSRINPSTEAGEATYMMQGLGQYAAGPGQAHLRRAELGDVEAAPSTRRSLAWFGQYSDFQLADDESPQRWCSIDNAMFAGSMRPQEALLPRAVSAMNGTFTRLAELSRSFDFGIITGDCADSAQRNELRWVIDIMDGQEGIETDSGEDNDPVPGPNNDPKDPFDAVAFPAPWLFVPGNHDTEIVGVAPVTDRSSALALGTLPQLGTRDYTQWYAPVTTRAVPADPERRPLDREEIIEELRNTPEFPGPVGHGYGATGDVDTSLGANYVYDAVPGLLRIVAVDTTDPSGGSVGMIRQPQVDGFLRPELDRALVDGVMVMLASHHSTEAMDRKTGESGPADPLAVEPETVRQLVASYSNVVAWLVGHTHANIIRAVPGADAEHPGYWEIMTAALADWPGQARTIEVVDNGNGTLSIFTTLIDFDEPSCFERRYRRLMLMDSLSKWGDQAERRPEWMNAELVLPIAASITRVVAEAPAHDRIESETALLGM